jgi:hypothetical protein
MKTIKQIREEYDNRVLDQAQSAPDELVLEGREKSKSFKSSSAVPSPSEMPAMLLFRRMAYRLYPNKQVVALYYSKAVDKYLSIPFGPDGNLNLSESSVYNTYEEMLVSEGAKWDIAKGALKGAAHGAIRGGAIGGAIAPGPGTVIGAGVGAVRGAYKGAKRASDKTVKESFQSRVAELREDREEQLDEFIGAAIKAVPAIGRAVAGSAAGEAIIAGGKKLVGAAGSLLKKLKPKAKTAPKPRKVPSGKGAALAGAAGAAAGSAASDSGGDSKPEDLATVGGYGDSAVTKTRGDLLRSKASPRTSSSWKAAPEPKQKKEPIEENKITDLRNMVESENSIHEMVINGKTITLNTTMAKRILEVYDSVNTKNKKIVESMLNEDLESFKKLLNFSIKA